MTSQPPSGLTDTQLGEVLAEGNPEALEELYDRYGTLSYSLAVASLDYDGTRVTLIDTPGYADFAAEVIQGFAAADAALFVMDASGGVESGLETAALLNEFGARVRILARAAKVEWNSDPNAVRSLIARHVQTSHVETIDDEPL